MRMVRKEINNTLRGEAGGRILNGKKESGKGYEGQKGAGEHLKIIFVNQ
jgi:hypothetical protein